MHGFTRGRRRGVRLLAYLTLLWALRRAYVKYVMYFPRLQCVADLWIVASARSPQHVERYLFQYPEQRPPDGICVLFAVHSHIPYQHLERERLHFVSTLQLPYLRRHFHIARARTSLKNVAYVLALHAGARTIYDTDDAAFFYLHQYGTGKGQSATVVQDVVLAVLPCVKHHCAARMVPSLGSPSVLDAAQLLCNGTRLQRGLPLRLLQAQLNTELYYTHLQTKKGSIDSCALVHVLANVNTDTEYLFRGVKIAPPYLADTTLNLSITNGRVAVAEAIRDAERLKDLHAARLSAIRVGPEMRTGAQLTNTAVTFPRGVLTPVNARTTFYKYAALWALFKFDTKVPLYADVLSAFVAQRVMWEAGLTTMAVEPGVDYVRAEDAPDVYQAVAQNHVLDHAVNTTLHALNVGTKDTVYSTMRLVASRLHEQDILPLHDIHALDAFHSDLRAMGYEPPPLLHELRHTSNKDGGLDEQPSTAVCMTGLMRSAPIAYQNIKRNILSAFDRAVDVFVVTARDERTASAMLFNPVRFAYSATTPQQNAWLDSILRANLSDVLHETMSTREHLKNYLRQIADQSQCLSLVHEHELRRKKKYKWLLRLRPDVIFAQKVSVQKMLYRGFVTYPVEHSFYAINDRFFGGERALMGRLLSCHGIFLHVLSSATVYNRTADVHSLFKRKVNSERFLARCAAMKFVPLRAQSGIAPGRVLYSQGHPALREFDWTAARYSNAIAYLDNRLSTEQVAV